MTESPKFITTCDEDEDGNLILPFPEELLEALGWTEGTTLDFDLIGDRLIIRKVVCTSDDQAG
jgi:antitoxin component of MazEF toxin-antitoxin module